MIPSAAGSWEWLFWSWSSWPFELMELLVKYSSEDDELDEDEEEDSCRWDLSFMWRRSANSCVWWLWCGFEVDRRVNGLSWSWWSGTPSLTDTGGGGGGGEHGDSSVVSACEGS